MNSVLKAKAVDSIDKAVSKVLMDFAMIFCFKEKCGYDEKENLRLYDISMKLGKKMDGVFGVAAQEKFFSLLSKRVRTGDKKSDFTDAAKEFVNITCGCFLTDLYGDSKSIEFSLPHDSFFEGTFSSHGKHQFNEFFSAAGIKFVAYADLPE